MDIQEREERLLWQKLVSEEFSADRKETIRIIEEILWEWNQKEQAEIGRNPLSITTGRVKTAKSIVEKLKRKGYDISFQGLERLHDLTGVRAVCCYLDDIYRLRNYILNYEGITLLREKDYIVQPKVTGYQSLHLILRLDMGECSKIAELQIRTVTMEHWSNLEHPIIYKMGKCADQQIGRELIEYAEFLREIDGILLAMRVEKGYCARENIPV